MLGVVGAPQVVQGHEHVPRGQGGQALRHHSLQSIGGARRDHLPHGGAKLLLGEFFEGSIEQIAGEPLGRRAVCDPDQDPVRVVVDDGTRPVTLTPEPRLEYFSFGDVDGSGAVDFGDILQVLASWGPCPEPPAECPADFDGNGFVGFADLLVVLANWT